MSEIEGDTYHDATYVEELVGRLPKPCPACSMPMETGQMMCEECLESDSLD